MENDDDFSLFRLCAYRVWLLTLLQRMHLYCRVHKHGRSSSDFSDHECDMDAVYEEDSHDLFHIKDSILHPDTDCSTMDCLTWLTSDPLVTAQRLATEARIVEAECVMRWHWAEFSGQAFLEVLEVYFYMPYIL